MRYLITYLITLVVFLMVDSVWLAKIAPEFYAARIGHLMADNVYFAAAGAFYLMYIAGIVYFAIRPALAERSIKTGLINGALFGFFCYATYDLTNLATLRDWPVDMVIIDLIWGTVLTGTVAGIVTWIRLRNVKD